MDTSSKKTLVKASSVTSEIVVTNSRGHIKLGPDARGKAYSKTQSEDGTIILTPIANIPEHELWLWQNPEALQAVRKGLEEASAGLGRAVDFSQYAGLEDDADRCPPSSSIRQCRLSLTDWRGTTLPDTRKSSKRWD